MEQKVLSIEDITRAIETIYRVAGEKWIKRKLNQLDSKPPPKNLQKHDYMFQKGPHPLIELLRRIKSQMKDTLDTKELHATDELLELARLGINLEKCEGCKGFDQRIRTRLKGCEFQSTAFEVQVAAAYINRGYEVEFIEEGSKPGVRTPDLLVITPFGPFYVECKHKEQESARDKRINKVWDTIEKEILNYLAQRKMNFAVAAKALQDPISADCQYLIDKIKSLIDERSNSTQLLGEEIFSKKDETGCFSIAVNKIVDYDVELEAAALEGQTSEAFDREKMEVSVKRNEDGTCTWKNPRWMTFKCSNPPDKIVGVIQSFKDAASQLPKTGAGVVWIELREYTNAEQLESDLKRLERLILAKLSSHRRVNAVILFTRLISKIEADGKEELGYYPRKYVIENKTPAMPLGEI